MKVLYKSKPVVLTSVIQEHKIINEISVLTAKTVKTELEADKVYLYNNSIKAVTNGVTVAEILNISDIENYTVEGGKFTVIGSNSSEDMYVEISNKYNELEDVLASLI